ncbi:MAG: MATE family efflux transporter [Elusimicrobiota bacterium]
MNIPINTKGPLTKKNPWKDILQMAWPLIIANSFWNLQMTIDRIYLGKHSTEALGAAMAVMGVFWVPMALLQQTASYVTTFVAQYKGAKEDRKIGAAIWQAIYVSIAGGLIMVLFNFFSHDFFQFVGHDSLVQKHEVAYYNSISHSALPTALVAVASGFFTGLGKTQTVIWINFVGLLANAILDYCLIFGKGGFPAFGVAGAGYATTIANYIAAFYGFWLVFRKKNEPLYHIFSSWKWKWDVMKPFLKFGVPSGLQWALEGLAFTTFLIIMGRLSNGEASLASSSIAVTVMMLSVLPSLGVAQSVMTMVGQKIGEGFPDEAEKYAWVGVKISSLYMAMAALSFAFIPEFYLSWFENKSNPELWSQVFIISAGLLKIVALFTVLDSIYLNISFALKGAGDTRFVSIMALLIPWPIMVLPTYLVREWNNAVYWSWGFAALYSLIISSTLIARFRQGKWKTMKVV